MTVSPEENAWQPRQEAAAETINVLRQRANASLITGADVNLDFILDERARELYWECTRRTDLVRFGKLVDASYLWPWKGGVKDGVGVDTKYNVYPLPVSDLNANPNLEQNAGY